MPNIDSDRDGRIPPQKEPSSQPKQRPNYHQALTTPLSIPTSLAESYSIAKDTPAEAQDQDPVRTLLNAMKRAANQYVRGPITARFAEINRKR